MKKQLIAKELAHIAPLKAGIILCLLYTVLSLLVVPLVLFSYALDYGTRHLDPMVGLLIAILIPVIYAVVGFICGVAGAAVYNLIAKWIGGFEFKVCDLPTIAPNESI